MTGFNNNPTTTQYQSAYKKLLSNKLNLIISSFANCAPLDNTLLVCEESTNNNQEQTTNNNKGLTTANNKGLTTNNDDEQVSNKSNSIEKKGKINSQLKIYNFLQDTSYHIFEQNYCKSENNGWFCSEYADEIIKHTAGAVVRILKTKIHYAKCYESLDGTNSSLKSRLTEIKNWRVLKFASDDVNYICKSTEKIIRQKKHLFTNNVYTHLIKETLKILRSTILDDDKHFLEQEPLMDYRSQIIVLIIQKYQGVTYHHAVISGGDFLDHSKIKVPIHMGPQTHRFRDTECQSLRKRTFLYFLTYKRLKTF
ncbi:hypothetical protein ABEB36_014592 [Hypothenemus hampei]|uniref:Uncharacterized protein n=1 Tax=Hypothenemus hampei TaxID=57062 RepID=A0ABD1E4Z0_HYPHA